MHPYLDGLKIYTPTYMGGVDNFEGKDALYGGNLKEFNFANLRATMFCIHISVNQEKCLINCKIQHRISDEQKIKHISNALLTNFLHLISMLWVTVWKQNRTVIAIID